MGVRKPFQRRIESAVQELLATELEALRSELLKLVLTNRVDLLEFTESAIAYLRTVLAVDRIFVCDMSSGEVVAGWHRGKNVVRLKDWDPAYVPLEMDRTLQKALESDEMVASPEDGEGADLAFSVHFDSGVVWLVVLDETQVARRFTPLDMAYLGLFRDLILVKERFANKS